MSHQFMYTWGWFQCPLLCMRKHWSSTLNARKASALRPKKTSIWKGCSREKSSMKSFWRLWIINCACRMLESTGENLELHLFHVPHPFANSNCIWLQNSLCPLTLLVVGPRFTIGSARGVCSCFYFYCYRSNHEQVLNLDVGIVRVRLVW